MQEIDFDKPLIELHDTTNQTMEDFLVWSFSPIPQIDDNASFDDVASLGIFAQHYRIPALSNQVTDVIRNHLASDEWQLQASIIDDIYRATSSGNPLREVVRMALGKLPPSTMDGGSKERDDWKATILKHSELGWDFLEASRAEWTMQAYLSGVCRFHDHQHVLNQKSPAALCDGCPYAQEDCYPSSPPNFVADKKAENVGGIQPPVQASNAVKLANTKPVDSFVDDTKSPAEGARVGNCIMVVDPEDKPNGVNGLQTINEGDTEPDPLPTNGTPEQNGLTESEDADDDVSFAVNSDNAPEEVRTVEEIVVSPTKQNAGTMTEAVNGDDTAEKVDGDGEAKLSKSKSKKKKKRGNSVSVAV